MKVLIVEDDPLLAAELARCLRRDHHVDVATSMMQAREKLASFEPTFLVLDRSLPDGDGLDILREVREGGHPLPALVLTAHGDVEDRIAGLDAGADDYLTKPFHMDELRARIRTIARRISVEEVVRVGALEIDLVKRRAYLASKELELTSREFALLTTFARHPGRLWTRTDLLGHAWGIRNDPHTNVVDVYVRHLRQKLGDDWIETVRGAGYRMSPPGGS